MISPPCSAIRGRVRRLSLWALHEVVRHGRPAPAVKTDNTGDTAKSGDETCTRTWYARNTSLGITGQPLALRSTSPVHSAR